MWPHTRTDWALALDHEELDLTVYRADSTLATAVGLMGRAGIDPNRALVFAFDRVRPRSVHMLGVRAPIVVWWLKHGVIVRCTRLDPWTGVAREPADMVIELSPAGPTAWPGTLLTIER